jgi:hypothetical protein
MDTINKIEAVNAFKAVVQQVPVVGQFSAQVENETTILKLFKVDPKRYLAGLYSIEDDDPFTIGDCSEDPVKALKSALKYELNYQKQLYTSFLQYVDEDLVKVSTGVL